MTVVKKIWAISKSVGMDRQDVYNVLQRETGKDSMRACTKKELERVLLSLRMIQGTDSARGNRASKKQVWKIGQLEQQLGWHDEPQRLLGFVKKYYKVERIEWLTSAQAWRLIESLKKLAEKGTTS